MDYLKCQLHLSSNKPISQSALMWEDHSMTKAHVGRPFHFVLCKFHENIFSSSSSSLLFQLISQECKYVHILSHTSSSSQQHKSPQNVERRVRYSQVVHCAGAAIVESLLFMTQSRNCDFKMQQVTLKKNASRSFVNSVDCYISYIRELRSLFKKWKKELAF